ncbi:pyridoxamine 5'-phosphate oxidase family protein [Paragemmobacter straminiformis]|uniref:Pyridoxamine 5'-phosphate oxidase family protein n=1 Tax=Paragemmobacter straminiformis TaxID=2045119 RepID=A0A842I9U4_9RHOB|nr:pyridoxamine 5'-phosphate oxidase family protein [Gemmobacter straminiformis]MBC2836405.1 pyridoxamine 5'-phosphate oxidase family protein [Gemmobacter straminiformis]
MPKDPVQAATPEAIALARDLLALPHAALAVTDPADGTPAISRIALGLSPDGPVTLISSLSAHHAALQADPACALLLGEPAAKGDPLTHPRLMLKARAEFVAPDDPARPALRDHWLQTHPKAKLYIDFADFAFVRLHPVSALLNAGFGKAHRLSADDLK